MTLDFRRALILAVVALCAEDLFSAIVDTEDLQALPYETRHRVMLELGRLLAGHGFGPAEEHSPPNYLGYCLEDAIDYIVDA